MNRLHHFLFFVLLVIAVAILCSGCAPPVKQPPKPASTFLVRAAATEEKFLAAPIWVANSLFSGFTLFSITPTGIEILHVENRTPIAAPSPTPTPAAK